MTPLQFVTRQRITRAQQLIRETSRSLIDVGLEVGYTQPEPFRASLPACGRRHANGVPELTLEFPAGLRQAPQDRESRTFQGEAVCVAMKTNIYSHSHSKSYRRRGTGAWPCQHPT